MAVRVTGIFWYRSREDYDRLKAMSKDGWKLPDTFDDWLQSAQNVLEELTSEGLVVEKAYVDPDTFPEWCRARGLEMDTKARLEYGTEFAAKKARAQQTP